MPKTNRAQNAQPCAPMAKFSIDSLMTENTDSSSSLDNNYDTLTMSSLDTNWTYVSVDEGFVQSFVADVIQSAVNIVKTENETYEREVQDLPKLDLQRLNSARSDISVSSLKRIQGMESTWSWRNLIPDLWMTRTFVQRSRVDQSAELTSITSTPV